MTDSEPEPEPEPGAMETADPSMKESMAEKEKEDSSGSLVQQACSDEKLSDSEKQQQLEDSSEASPAEETPGKCPAHIERCSSLDDVKLTQQKVMCSYYC
jgi:hypothetical protein